MTVATPATMPTIASTLIALLGAASLSLGPSEMLTLEVPPPVTLTLMLLFLLLLSPEVEPVGAGVPCQLSHGNVQVEGATDRERGGPPAPPVAFAPDPKLVWVGLVL